MPGTILAARYFIIRKLGEGGMGAVYLVTDSRLGGKKCALKEMSDGSVTNPAELNQAKVAFQRESEMLSALSHPVLPRVTDFFTLADKHYLVMDFANGLPLDEIIEKRTRPFPESQVLYWADQLCDVLVYLHSQNPPIIYRDLKPGNIMLAPDRMSLKLIDFGIARIFKPKQTKDTIAMGTPGYAPPEQYGKEQTDQRSDIYALGSTLHHLLTLRDPGDNPFRFPQVTSLNPRVSDQVNRVIMKAVEQDRENRWSTVKEMAQALEVSPSLSTNIPASTLASHNRSAKPVSNPQVPGNIPSTPLSSLAASFLSQSSVSRSNLQLTWKSRIKKIIYRIRNPRISFSAPSFQRTNIRRDYSWVALACFGSVMITLVLDEMVSMGSLGYWGDIISGIFCTLPFLFSAVFIKRVGAAFLPVLVTGLFDSGLHFNPFIIAFLVELPFLLVGYRQYHYQILFLAALLYGLGNHVLLFFGEGYFAFEEIIHTSMVSFLSPFIVYTAARISKRI
jgi:serine/threonine protein kinase